MCQASEKGPYSHEKTSHSNESGPMQLGPEMADHSKKQQVAYLQERETKRAKENIYTCKESSATHSNWKRGQEQG